jgi:hypothetical protein
VDSKSNPSDEVAAATDEVFSRQPELHPEPGGADATPTMGPVLTGADAETGELSGPPMLRPDYVRELQ